MDSKGRGPEDPSETVNEGIREKIDELGDPELSPTLPSAAIATAASQPASASQRRGLRSRTDREIWQLAWPVILSQVLVSAVSLIDVAMVGRLDAEAVAAVGYTTQYVWLTHSVLFAVGIACVALMSRAIGGGNLAEARSAHAATQVVSLAIALGISVVTVLFPGPLMALLGAQESIIALGIPYFRLTLAAMLPLSVCLVLESAYRADKNTVTPMVIAVLVTLTKTALNFLLIFGMFGAPRLGLAGAGWATFLAEIVALAAFGVAVVRVPRASPLRLRLQHFAIPRARMAEVVRVSLPAIGERLVMNAAMMAYFALLGVYGTPALAAYTIGVRLLSFSWIPGTGFSVAAATMVGQSLGTNDVQAAERAGWRAARLGLYVSSVLGALYAFGREPLARAFTTDAAVIEALMPFMLILALAQPFMGLHFTLGGSLRGAGDTLTPFLAASVSNWGLRVPIAWAAAYVWHLDVVWVWCALVTDHFSRAIWHAWAFHRGRWRNQALARRD